MYKFYMIVVNVFSAQLSSATVRNVLTFAPVSRACTPVKQKLIDAFFNYYYALNTNYTHYLTGK
jgi:hypothetical protein